MRIIAGHARGRRLTAPKGRHTRPTTDRVREAMFSIIGSRVAIDGARVLDLFAGTGALGCEALSRGAAGAVFVDSSREAERTIKENLRRIDRRGLVVRRKLPRALGGIDAPDGFDLVLMDPPYDAHAVAATLSALLEADLLAEGALVLAEHGADEPMPSPEGVAPLTEVMSRAYGDTTLTLYRAPDHSASEQQGAPEHTDDQEQT